MSLLAATMMIAIIPAPMYADASQITDYTKLPVKQVYGYEYIMDDSGTKNLVRGFACLLECTREELKKEHPNTFYSVNPVLGEWNLV